MTREEALNEIKSWDFLEGKEIEAIETLIPELAESEDERIRKHLIEIVEIYWGTTNEPGKAADLAWLEKQKENPDRLVLIGKAKSEKQVVLLAESNGDENIYWDTKSEEDAVSLLEKGLKFFGMQKPSDLSEMMVHKEPYIAPVSTPMVADEQKSAEWSEEDERKYQCIRNILLTDMDKKIGSWKYSEILEWYEKRGIGRYTNSKLHWKPSKEQMEALERTIHLANFGLEVDRKKALESLYEQIKKL